MSLCEGVSYMLEYVSFISRNYSCLLSKSLTRSLLM